MCGVWCSNHADVGSDAWRLEEFTRELKRNKNRVSSQYALEFPRMSRSAGIWFLPHPNQITRERLLFSEPKTVPSLRLMNELGKVCNIYSTAVGSFFGTQWFHAHVPKSVFCYGALYIPALADYVECCSQIPDFVEDYRINAPAW